MKKNKIGVLLISMAVLLQSTVLAGTVQQPTVVLDGGKLPEWEATISSYGGKLLLSDSPEIVPGDGIMYQDTVMGDNRLFFHHVNGTSSPKKVIVLLENATEKPAHVTVYKYGLGGPGYDFLEVGKKVQVDYIEGKDAYLLEVPAGDSIGLIPSLEQDVVQPNMLVNGMYDFTTDQPIKVKFMMMPVDADSKDFAKLATVLPPDNGQYRLRGTFEGKDRLVVSEKVYDAKDGSVAVTLADNVLDPYVTGIDATDGTKTTNYGNYGVVYKMYLPSIPQGKISYYLNPRGGEYAGWLGTKYRHQEVATIATPADKMSFGSKPSSESAYIGTYEGGKSLWLTFSPPGASNLPIKFIIKPTK